ncbi:cupin domain-containing protein [Rahnella aquatilis]|nr:cupin domain-containing protein [Rahnella aquatilis]
MSRCGDVYENIVTGEYAVILRGSEDRGSGPAIIHLIARPSAEVVGEHFHPYLIEKFTVIKGQLGARIDGQTLSLPKGKSLTIEAGVVHDWWNNSATDEAHVLIEINPLPSAIHIDPKRFELLIGVLFGLANDGKVNKKGKPFPLQAAVIAREFADVIVFTKPSLFLQKILLGVLAPLGRALGYRAVYAHYTKPHRHVIPDPEVLVAAGISAS